MGSGQQYVKPPSSDTCSDKNPLFIIVDVFCLYSILRKFMNNGENPIFSIVLYRRALFCQRLSLGLFVISRNSCFLFCICNYSYLLSGINYQILFYLVWNSFVLLILCPLIYYILAC